MNLVSVRFGGALSVLHCMGPHAASWGVASVSCPSPRIGACTVRPGTGKEASLQRFRACESSRRVATAATTAVLPSPIGCLLVLRVAWCLSPSGSGGKRENTMRCNMGQTCLIHFLVTGQSFRGNVPPILMQRRHLTVTGLSNCTAAMHPARFIISVFIILTAYSFDSLFVQEGSPTWNHPILAHLTTRSCRFSRDGLSIALPIPPHITQFFHLFPRT